MPQLSTTFRMIMGITQPRMKGIGISHLSLSPDSLRLVGYLQWKRIYSICDRHNSSVEKIRDFNIGDQFQDDHETAISIRSSWPRSCLELHPVLCCLLEVKGSLFMARHNSSQIKPDI